MNNWNPHNKKLLFFHVTYGPDECRKQDYYIKIDTIDKRVWKLQHVRHLLDVDGRTHKEKIPGIYEIKWSTFISKHMWHLKKDNRNFSRQCENNDGHQRYRIRYTTEKQWNEGITQYLKSIDFISSL